MVEGKQCVTSAVISRKLIAPCGDISSFHPFVFAPNPHYVITFAHKSVQNPEV